MNITLPDKDELEATAATLNSSKDAILEIWKKQIQLELPAARDKTKIALEDHMPELLKEMVLTIKKGVYSGATQEQNELSKQHGRQRADLGGYTLEEVLEEYRIAREIIIFEMNKKIFLSAKSQCMMNRIIDRAIIEAGTEFSKFQNAENEDAKLKAERAQDKAEQAQNRAEIANQAKSDFLANISHEIRTPLGAVLGFTELMRDPALSIPDRIEFAEIVNRNGRQLSTLINDMLDISKIEAGQLLVEHVSTSLPAIISEVTILLRGEAENKGIKLNVESWHDIPENVISDPTRLMQILTNMIGNSIKFTHTGEVRVALERTAKAGDQEFRFVVTDTGIGISEEHKGKLFRSFSQADTSTTRRFGGTGLGLFLSKKLANALGGDLVLYKSVLNEGSVFIATFQAKIVTDTPITLEKEKDTKSQRARLESVRILLAEDSPDNQVLVIRYLGAEGAKIDIANNGEEALNLALKNDYDVLLLDIQMPIMDGYETAKNLRSKGYLKPIIALTANAMVTEKEKAFSSGCNAHLIKPINRTELIRTIQTFINPKKDHLN